jgi:hypothetical protein
MPLKKSKSEKLVNLAREFFTKSIVVFGIFTLVDFLFFEKVMTNEVMVSNLWKSPIMAFFLIILNRVMVEKNREAITHLVDGEKI